MREISIPEAAALVAEKISGAGVFLCSSDGARQNVMTIGWGGVNTFYAFGCFIAPVRTSRYTYDLMMKNGSFTVSVPLHDMRKELGFTGSKSGRDVNKFEGHGLTAAPAQAVNVPIVQECELQIECVPFARSELLPQNMTDEVLNRWYPDRDMHTLFMGKIVKCYRLD